MPTVGKETSDDFKIGYKLDSKQERQVKQLLYEYSGIFRDIPGTSNLKEHRVNLTTSDSVLSDSCQVPHNVREEGHTVYGEYGNYHRHIPRQWW